MPRVRRPSAPSPAANQLAKSGVTMAEVATMSGTTAMTVSRILSGRAPMRPEVARAIHKLAGPANANAIISRIPARPKRRAASA